MSVFGEDFKTKIYDSSNYKNRKLTLGSKNDIKRNITTDVDAYNMIFCISLVHNSCIIHRDSTISKDSIQF